MNMSGLSPMGSGSGISSSMQGAVHDWQWAQEVWPNCRNLTILGPKTPQKPPSFIVKASQMGHDSWYGMEKYSKICTWISLGLIGMTIIPGLIHRWRVKQPLRSHTFFTTTILGRMYLMGLTVFRMIGYQTPSFSWGKKKWRRCYLPQTSHLIVIASVWIGLIAWTFSIRPYYRCLRVWGSPPLAVRAGMMANAFFPFLFTLGSKFNLVSIVTNISYEKLQVYHQWLARLVLLLSVIHTIPFLIQPMQEGGSSLLHEFYYSPGSGYLLYWSGTVALVFLIWMVISSTSALRNMSYEFFVLQHVLSIVLFLAFYFIHTNNELHSWLWLWATVGLWAFAILVRILRGALASDFFVGKYALLETQMKDIEIHNSTQEQEQDPLVRISVRTPVRWSPGQHILLHFPSLGFMQPHPFTVTTLPDTNKPNFESTAVFVARARSGLTRTLYGLARMGTPLSKANRSLCPENCASQNNEEIQEKDVHEGTFPKEQDTTVGAFIPVSVDGPYGANASMASYDGILLVAGGSGFSVIISVLQDLAIKVVRQPEQVVTKRIFIHWSIRTLSTFDWMKQQLDRCVEILREKGKIEVQVQIAITRSSIEEEKAPQMPNYANYTAGQRALIEQVCSDAIDEMATNSVRSMSCVVCGPIEMGLQTQNSVRRAQRKILRGRLGTLLELYLFKSNFYW